MPTLRLQLQYIHTLIADEEGIYGFASLHRVGLTQHGKIYRVDYGLELSIMQRIGETVENTQTGNLPVKRR